MAKEKDNSVILAIGIILLFIVGLMLFRYNHTFAISQGDLEITGAKTEVLIDQGGSYDLFSVFAIANNSISFTISGTTKTYNSPAVFFMLDNSPTIYDTFQDISEGTHTLKEYQLYIDFDKIHIKKWEKTYDVLVKTVYINQTIANETFYINVPYNVTINNTRYINNTIEKIVTIEPDLNAWLNKYKLYIAGVVGLGLVYYLTRMRNRK